MSQYKNQNEQKKLKSKDMYVHMYVVEGLFENIYVCMYIYLNIKIY